MAPTSKKIYIFTTNQVNLKPKQTKQNIPGVGAFQKWTYLQNQYGSCLKSINYVAGTQKEEQVIQAHIYSIYML